MISPPFDLEKAVATWRQFHSRRRVFLREDLDELERHLRDHTATLKEQGLGDEAAFRGAVQALGDLDGGADEYGKVYWAKLRRRNQLLPEISWNLSMLKNFSQIALRNLRKQKLYSFINIFGLAVGIACCLLIGLYVQHERSYDSFHEKAERIYRLTYENRMGADLPPAAPHEYNVWGSAAIAPVLQTEFPEVERTVRLSGRHEILLTRNDRSFQEERYFFADSTFFDVFSFRLLQGDPKTVLLGPSRLVLAERAARRYFGDEDAMGRTVRIGSKGELTVTGVMADVPANSHLDFDILISMSTFENDARATDQAYKFDAWGYVDFFTYVLLREGASADVLQSSLPAFVQRQMGSAIQNQPQSYTLQLEPITEAYHSPAGTLAPLQSGPRGNAANLAIFSIIGVFILIIACLNFMNLATARSASRAKEVGVRKSVGARRGGLVGQFLMEAGIMTAFAAITAALITALALPLFRTLADKEISAAPLTHPLVLVALIMGALVVGLLSGAYPAFVLSRFRPSQVLKGSFATSSRGAALRKGLVVFQFAVAIALIVGTLVVRQQLHYLQEQPLGFDGEQQLVLDFGFDPDVRDNLETIKRELATLPGIQSAAATRSVPGGYFPDAGTGVEAPDGTMRRVAFGLYEVDTDFLPQIGAVPAAGRLFSREFPTDAEEALLVNEAAVRELGFSDPSDVVGKRFTQWGREGQIVGVVRDFNFESLHSEIRPLFFRVSPWLKFIVLRVDADDAARVVPAVRERWSTLAPHRPFLFSFLDQSFETLYRNEDRFATLFGIFAALAIFVASLGLFGLAAFSAQQRTKEIGVRKVLGATAGSIAGLLSRDFLLLVLVGIVVAVPAAYYFMGRWLEDFAYRIELGAGIFLLAGGVALAVAVATVSYQAVRAAMADPVKSLRYE